MKNDIFKTEKEFNISHNKWEEIENSTIEEKNYFIEDQTFTHSYRVIDLSNKYPLEGYCTYPDKRDTSLIFDFFPHYFIADIFFEFNIKLAEKFVKFLAYFVFYSKSYSNESNNQVLFIFDVQEL